MNKTQEICSSTFLNLSNSCHLEHCSIPGNHLFRNRQDIFSVSGTWKKWLAWWSKWTKIQYQRFLLPLVTLWGAFLCWHLCLFCPSSWVFWFLTCGILTSFPTMVVQIRSLITPCSAYKKKVIFCLFPFFLLAGNGVRQNVLALLDVYLVCFSVTSLLFYMVFEY